LSFWVIIISVFPVSDQIQPYTLTAYIIIQGVNTVYYLGVKNYGNAAITFPEQPMRFDSTTPTTFTTQQQIKIHKRIPNINDPAYAILLN
jgi:hypothetical protein